MNLVEIESWEERLNLLPGGDEEETAEIQTYTHFGVIHDALYWEKNVHICVNKVVGTSGGLKADEGQVQ